MKRLQIVFALVFIYSISVFAQGDWQWISPYPTQNPLRSSCVTGSSFYYWGDMETVLSTYDAGNTFNTCARYADVDDSGYENNVWQRIAFSDSLTGIVLEKGVHRTTDGGKSWKKIFDRSYIFKVATFVNSKVGWMFGAPCSEKTIDGGKTWNSICAEIRGPYSRIFPLDENRVWLLTSYHYYNQGEIFISEDGCETWNIVETPLIQEDSLVEISYYDIKITTSGLGIAIGSIYYKNERKRNSFILRTTDFGNTWNTEEVEKINLNHIIKISEDNWQIYGNMESDNYSHKIVQLMSSDSAKTWQIKTNVFLANYNYHYLYNINYLPKQKIILAATNGGIFRSDNLGSEFYKLTNETDIPIIDFAIDNSNKLTNQLAVAISDDNRYLISENGARSWKLSFFPDKIGTKIRETYVVDGTIFINANGRRIYSSNDKGVTWNRLFYNNGYAFRNLTAYNKNIIAFTGYDNSRKVYYSIDGGRSWKNSPLSEKISINSLQIVNPSTIVGGGAYIDTSSSNGMIYRSDDFGKNWRVIDFPREIEHIIMLNENKGFAHSHYELYRTEDAGISWSLDLSSDDYYDYYSNFSFADSLNGLMRESYYFKETKNGGRSWETINKNCPIWGGFKRMEYNNQGDLIILGEDGGLVIKQSDLNISKSNLSNNINISSAIELEQNYPNPFNPTTTISFELPQKEYVSLEIFNTLGEKVSSLVNKELNAGSHKIYFDATSLPSGVYIYRIVTKINSISKKMTLIK